LLTGDGLGTAAIMQRTGKSKSVAWRTATSDPAHGHL